MALSPRSIAVEGIGFGPKAVAVQGFAFTQAGTDYYVDVSTIVEAYLTSATLAAFNFVHTETGVAVPQPLAYETLAVQALDAVLTLVAHTVTKDGVAQVTDTATAAQPTVHTTDGHFEQTLSAIVQDTARALEGFYNTATTTAASDGSGAANYGHTVTDALNLVATLATVTEKHTVAAVTTLLQGLLTAPSQSNKWSDETTTATSTATGKASVGVTHVLDVLGSSTDAWAAHYDHVIKDVTQLLVTLATDTTTTSTTYGTTQGDVSSSITTQSDKYLVLTDSAVEVDTPAVSQEVTHVFHTDITSTDLGRAIHDHIANEYATALTTLFTATTKHHAAETYDPWAWLSYETSTQDGTSSAESIGAVTSAPGAVLDVTAFGFTDIVSDAYVYDLKPYTREHGVFPLQEEEYTSALWRPNLFVQLQQFYLAAQTLRQFETTPVTLVYSHTDATLQTRESSQQTLNTTAATFTLKQRQSAK